MWQCRCKNEVLCATSLQQLVPGSISIPIMPSTNQFLDAFDWTGKKCFKASITAYAADAVSVDLPP